ncbi:ALF repeat-containing protein, partial [Streptomyces sp. NPDC048389]|uniref:ALF repeat-containing protein n=1 Tax=Streptomyces sp. NPDC048389 TaxID=3154622 RepID=UPI00345165E5
SSAQAQRARDAAADARRHAAEATRAANKAVALAGKAARAAREARDAANSAAVHARNAGAAAEKAADHAGDAALAATESTKHAAEAKKAADAATAAVVQAKSTYDLAREVEAEELADRRYTEVEQAKALKAEYDAHTARERTAAAEARAADEEALRLEAEVNEPDADLQEIAAKARKIALHVAKTRGPWSVTTAEAALAGSDALVVEYIRTGLKEAARRDEYARTVNLAWDSEYENVRTAAKAALTGDAARISSFIATGQHEAAANDYRVRVTQLMNNGGRAVTTAGREALESGSTEAMRQFVHSGYYTARTSDERVRAVQLRSFGGPELKAAADVALAGPPQVLHRFIEVEQYSAARQDKLTATHVSRMQGLIAGAARVAATAQQNAALAAKVAAEARKAAAEAAEYAKQAQASAVQAGEHAEEADAHADAAETSAAEAAASARTARAAEADAKNAVRRADLSANQAQASAAAAQASASDAWAAADAAYASSVAAGKDADAASRASTAAGLVAFQKLQEEIRQHFADLAAEAEERSLRAEDEEFAEYMAKLEEIDWGKVLSEGGHFTLDVLGLIPGFGEAADGINCAWYFGEGEVVDAGLSCAGMVPFAGWGAAGAKFGKWGTKADDFFRKLFGKNPAFALCARSLARSMSLAAASSVSCPVGFQNLGNDIFQSPGGLVYMRENANRHRIDHIMDHTRPNPDKPLHGVFNEKDQGELLSLIDDAWSRRGSDPIVNRGNKVFPVEYENPIGEGGERFMCIVTRYKSKKYRVITAYPSASRDCPTA